MIRRTVPKHSLLGQMAYVAPDDTAWDTARVKAEREALDEGASHAVDDYLSGRTRYQFDLVSPYLDDAQRPTVVHFRRLSIEESATVDSLSKRDKDYLAKIYAFSVGVTRIENSGHKELDDALAQKDRDPLAVQKLAHEWSESTLLDAGTAVIVGSWDLSDAEKKA